MAQTLLYLKKANVLFYAFTERKINTSIEQMHLCLYVLIKKSVLLSFIHIDKLASLIIHPKGSVFFLLTPSFSCLKRYSVFTYILLEMKNDKHHNENRKKSVYLYEQEIRAKKYSRTNHVRRSVYAKRSQEKKKWQKGRPYMFDICFFSTACKVIKNPSFAYIYGE